jgi:hypothetical protein
LHWSFQSNMLRMDLIELCTTLKTNKFQDHNKC